MLDARTEAIVHLAEAFAEQGESFADLMNDDPKSAEQAVQEWLDEHGDGQDDLDLDDTDDDDTDTYDPSQDLDEEAA